MPLCAGFAGPKFGGGLLAGLDSWKQHDTASTRIRLLRIHGLRSSQDDYGRLPDVVAIVVLVPAICMLVKTQSPRPVPTPSAALLAIK
jgi:hypothetical protein